MERHIYTQEEKDELHDLYLELKHLDDKFYQINKLKQNILDNLISDLSDGDIMCERIDSELYSQIRFVKGELSVLINMLSDAEI